MGSLAASSSLGRRTAQDPTESLKPADCPDVLNPRDAALAVAGELVPSGESGEIRGHRWIHPRCSTDSARVLGWCLIGQSSQALMAPELGEGAHVRGHYVVR